MSIYLETDVQPEAPCRRCAGSGEIGHPDTDWCYECGGSGTVGVGAELVTLAHNLAIAGAMFTVRHDLNGLYYDRKYWRPGDGRPHPRWPL